MNFKTGSYMLSLLVLMVAAPHVGLAFPKGSRFVQVIGKPLSQFEKVFGVTTSGSEIEARNGTQVYKGVNHSARSFKLPGFDGTASLDLSLNIDQQKAGKGFGSLVPRHFIFRHRGKNTSWKTYLRALGLPTEGVRVQSLIPGQLDRLVGVKTMPAAYEIEFWSDANSGQTQMMIRRKP